MVVLGLAVINVELPLSYGPPESTIAILTETSPTVRGTVGGCVRFGRN